MKGRRRASRRGRRAGGACGRVCLALLACGLPLVAVPAAAAGEGWLTNYDLVREVTREAVRQLLDDYAPAPQARLRLAVQPPHEAAALIEEFMEPALVARGATVVTDTVPAATTLEVHVAELGLRYTGEHRIFPFGGKRIERLAVASLSVRARAAPAAAAAWQHAATVRRLDEVPAAKLPILEGPAYPFTAPRLPPGHMGRVLEPVIVSVIVVGLVFLFVSNRS